MLSLSLLFQDWHLMQTKHNLSADLSEGMHDHTCGLEQEVHLLVHQALRLHASENKQHIVFGSNSTCFSLGTKIHNLLEALLGLVVAVQDCKWVDASLPSIQMFLAVLKQNKHLAASTASMPDQKMSRRVADH